MPIKAQKPEKLEKRLKMLVYGPAGIGKTTAAIQFPAAVLVDMERGADNYAETIAKAKSVVLQTSNPEEVKQEVKALLTEKHAYKTLIIDPITVLYGALQDKWNRVFQKYASSDKQSELQDFGFRYWARVKSEYKSIMRMLTSMDMNLICTSHQKDIYGAGMQRVGVGPDSMKGDEYVFDYVFQLEIIAGKRMARTIKERAEIGKSKFPETFEWSYQNFCKYYGQEVIEKEARPVVMATPEQVKEIAELLDTVKVEDDWIQKCFTKADCESWDEMDGTTIQKCIDYLKKKLEPTKPKEKVGV